MQKLTASIKIKDYLKLFITKDGKDYAIEAHKSDFQEFMLNDVKWYEIVKTGAAEHSRNGGREITLDEIANDLANQFQSDQQMQRDYAAAWVDLTDDDLAMPEEARNFLNILNSQISAIKNPSPFLKPETMNAVITELEAVKSIFLECFNIKEVQNG